MKIVLTSFVMVIETGENLDLWIFLIVFRLSSGGEWEYSTGGIVADVKIEF